MSNTAQSELLTLRECEELTKRRVATWRNDIREKKIPYVRIGRQIRIPREVLELLIAQGRVGTVRD
jgi:excisionase family DNA binding protein